MKPAWQQLCVCVQMPNRSEAGRDAQFEHHRTGLSRGVDRILRR
jgi:hypothetical protein